MGKENEYLFNLKDCVKHKDYNKELIVIGLSTFLNQPKRVLCQDEPSFSIAGLDFTKGVWHYQYELVLIERADES